MVHPGSAFFTAIVVDVVYGQELGFRLAATSADIAAIGAEHVVAQLGLVALSLVALHLTDALNLFRRAFSQLAVTPTPRKFSGSLPVSLAPLLHAATVPFRIASPITLGSFSVLLSEKFFRCQVGIVLVFVLARCFHVTIVT